MAQVRECTRCSRRIYSFAETDWNCKQHSCTGVMRIVLDRQRYVYRMDGTRKLGEFW